MHQKNCILTQNKLGIDSFISRREQLYHNTRYSEWGYSICPLN